MTVIGGLAEPDSDGTGLAVYSTYQRYLGAFFFKIGLIYTIDVHSPGDGRTSPTKMPQSNLEVGRALQLFFIDHNDFRLQRLTPAP